MNLSISSHTKDLLTKMQNHNSAIHKKFITSSSLQDATV